MLWRDRSGAGETVLHSAAISSPLPLSFVACISDNEVLQSNLLASPCLRNGPCHEAILLRNCSSAAAGLNLGIARAETRGWRVYTRTCSSGTDGICD